MSGNAITTVTWQGSARSALGAHGFVAYIKLNAAPLSGKPRLVSDGVVDLRTNAANTSGRFAALESSDVFAHRRERPVRLLRRT